MHSDYVEVFNLEDLEKEPKMFSLGFVKGRNGGGKGGGDGGSGGEIGE